MAAIEAAVAPLGLYADEAGGIPVLLDRDRPRPSSGVHLIFSEEPIRKGQDRRFPSVASTVRSRSGFAVINLGELVRMKLEAFRLTDQVHLQDMLRLGLIDAAITPGLPEDLLEKLRQVRDTIEWPGPPPAF